MQAFKAANPGCVLADLAAGGDLSRRGDNGGGGEGDNGGGGEGDNGGGGEGGEGEGDAGGADDGADDEPPAKRRATPVPASQQRLLFDAEREAHDAPGELAEVLPLSSFVTSSCLRGAIACLRASPLRLLSAHAKQRAADALKSETAAREARRSQR